VYTRENPNKANTLEYVDKDGNFLTQEQIKAYHDFKSTKNEDKKKAARKRLDTIGKENNTKQEVKKEVDNSQKVKEDKKSQPANNQKSSGKRGVIPGQNIQKQSSGNPVIDKIVDTAPKVVRQWLMDNKLSKQGLSDLLKDLLDKNKISSDLLSELLSSLRARNINKANSILDNIMKCRQ
jgi:hypothetical protein